MPEWSIGTVSKTVVLLRVPRVRIPVFPQPKRTKVGLIKTNHGLSTSSVVFCIYTQLSYDIPQTKI